MLNAVVEVRTEIERGAGQLGVLVDRADPGPAAPLHEPPDTVDVQTLLPVPLQGAGHPLELCNRAERVAGRQHYRRKPYRSRRVPDGQLEDLLRQSYRRGLVGAKGFQARIFSPLTTMPHLPRDGSLDEAMEHHLQDVRWSRSRLSKRRFAHPPSGRFSGRTRSRLSQVTTVLKPRSSRSRARWVVGVRPGSTISHSSQSAISSRSSCLTEVPDMTGPPARHRDSTALGERGCFKPQPVPTQVACGCRPSGSRTVGLR